MARGPLSRAPATFTEAAGGGSGPGARTRDWLRWLVALAFVVSFALPAAHVGGEQDRPAPGLMAALLAGYVLPLVIRLAARSGSAADGYALVTGGYLLLLLLLNGFMLYGLWEARRGRASAAWTLALAWVAAALPWGALLVDYGRLQQALSLAGGHFFLREGYYLWASSFVLLALLLRRGTPVRRTP